MSDPSAGPAEASLWIGINGMRRRLIPCSPHQLAAVAIGHLVAEGCIRSMRDIIGVEPVDGPGGARGVNVVIDPARADAAEALRQHRLEHGCGLRHELDCEPGSLPRQQRAAPPALDLSAAFRALFGAAEQASASGGLHACALLRGDEILYIDTDVARHTSVDRVLGLAVQDGAALHELGLLLSARLSGAMALKAALARVGWVASRSVATSLATEIANAAQLPVLQRAVRRTGAE